MTLWIYWQEWRELLIAHTNKIQKKRFFSSCVLFDCFRLCYFRWMFVFFLRIDCEGRARERGNETEYKIPVESLSSPNQTHINKVGLVSLQFATGYPSDSHNLNTLTPNRHTSTGMPWQLNYSAVTFCPEPIYRRLLCSLLSDTDENDGFFR